MRLYRPWGARSSPLRDDVLRNPKRALPVAIGSVAAILLVVARLFIAFGTAPPRQQIAGQPPQTARQQPPQVAGSNWRDRYRIQRDFHHYNQSVFDNVIRDKQRSDERGLETDRHRCDWHGKKD